MPLQVKAQRGKRAVFTDFTKGRGGQNLLRSSNDKMETAGRDWGETTGEKTFFAKVTPLHKGIDDYKEFSAGGEEDMKALSHCESGGKGSQQKIHIITEWARKSRNAQSSDQMLRWDEGAHAQGGRTYSTVW